MTQIKSGLSIRKLLTYLEQLEERKNSPQGWGKGSLLKNDDAELNHEWGKKRARAILKGKTI